jgi:hypothetical protein
MYKVIVDGFKTKAQAKEFMKWYEGGGEQMFYDHLDIVGKSADDGCNVNMDRKGNTGRYYDETIDGYRVEVS